MDARGCRRRHFSLRVTFLPPLSHLRSVRKRFAFCRLSTFWATLRGGAQIIAAFGAALGSIMQAPVLAQIKQEPEARKRGRQTKKRPPGDEEL